VEMLLLCEKISDNEQPPFPVESGKTLQAVEAKQVDQRKDVEINSSED
jgi:hypothetical protein